MRIVVGTLIFAALVNGSLVAAHWVAITSWGSRTPLLFATLFAGALLLAALAAVPTGLVLLAVVRPRKPIVLGLLAPMVYLATAIPLERLAARIRMTGFDDLAGRARPLVNAIKSYTADHGRPPAALSALVPRYLATIPDTGMGAYPTYRYATGAEAERYGGNDWVLIVSTPSAIMGFDQFIYLPDQQYPVRGYGGRLERIRDWAYVHE